jgi:hypothetical protein
MAGGWDTSRSASIVLPLAMFDACTITFTFPDSIPQARGPDYAARAYHGEVYALPEIEDVVRRHGFPDPKLPRNRGTDAFIEVSGLG